MKLPSGNVVVCRTREEDARVRDWLRWVEDEAEARAARKRAAALAGALCAAVSTNPETGRNVTCVQVLHGGVCRYHGRRSGA